MEQQQSMTPMVAIKTYFEADGGKPVKNREILELKKTDPGGYSELADMAGAALGVTLERKPVSVG